MSKSIRISNKATLMLKELSKSVNRTESEILEKIICLYAPELFLQEVNKQVGKHIARYGKDKELMEEMAFMECNAFRWA